MEQGIPCTKTMAFCKRLYKKQSEEQNMRRKKGFLEWLEEKMIQAKVFLAEKNEGMGTVEIILIIVVLIGLVIIFKDQITDLVNDIFSKITKQSNRI